MVAPLEIPTEDALVRFDSTGIEITYEITDLRVDIIRQTHSVTRTETTTDSNGNSVQRQVTTQVADPYHPIGVHLGNGLFIDANRNVAISIPHMLALFNEENFTVTKKSRGFFDPEIVKNKTGNSLVFKLDGKEYLVGEVYNDGVHYEIYGFLNKQVNDIFIDRNSITYDPHGMFGWGKMTIFKEPGKAYMPGFWKDYAIEEKPDGSIQIGDGLTLTHSGKTMILQTKGFWGPGRTYYFSRTDDTLYVYNKDNYGFQITYYSNGIEVYNGSYNIIYMLE